MSPKTWTATPFTTALPGAVFGIERRFYTMGGACRFVRKTNAKAGLPRLFRWRITDTRRGQSWEI